jgi:hypothetical protein
MLELWHQNITEHSRSPKPLKSNTQNELDENFSDRKPFHSDHEVYIRNYNHIGLIRLNTVRYFCHFIHTPIDTCESELKSVCVISLDPGYLFTRDLTTTIKISFLLYAQLNATRPKVRMEVL